VESTVTLSEGMAFTVDVDGHQLTIDATSEHGGVDAGPQPKTLLLSSLAGCTAMDVISMLRKMRQPVTALAVKAEGELTDEHPRTFVDLHVTYTVEGDVEPGRLKRAVELSEDKYCGVSAMLRSHTSITSTIVLNGEKLV
jgi:putative redox protein